MNLSVPENIVLNILDFAKANYPREIILLLRGKRNRDEIQISDYLFPPFGTGGKGFASFPIYMLPIDFSIIGTAHSHPSGVLKPSIGDLTNFYGLIMVIVGPPFKTSSFVAFNKKGEEITVSFKKSKF